MKHRIIKILSAAIVPGMALFAADELIKNKVEKEDANIPEAADKSDTKLVLCGSIRLRRLHNTGAFGSLLNKSPGLVKGLSAAFGSMILAFLIFKTMMALKDREEGDNLRHTLWLLFLSLLTGGAASNTKDRLLRGHVVDYFSLAKAPGKIKNLVFNISDWGIGIGSLGGLLLYLTENDETLGADDEVK